MKKFFFNIDLEAVTMVVITVIIVVLYVALFIPWGVASHYHWHSSPVRDLTNNICAWILVVDLITFIIYVIIGSMLDNWQNKTKRAIKAQEKKEESKEAPQTIYLIDDNYVCHEMRQLVEESEKACNVISEELHKFTPDNNRILGAVAQLENIDHLFVQKINTYIYTENDKYYYNKYGRLHFSKYTYNKYVQKLYNKVYGYGAICFCSYVEEESKRFPF